MVRRVFFDNFEDYPLGPLPVGKWAKDDFRNMPQVVSVATDGKQPPFSGTKMLRCNWDGTVPWNSPPAYETAVITAAAAPYVNEVLIRVRFRADTNLTRSPGSAAKVNRVLSNGVDLFGTLRDKLGNEGVVWGKQVKTYWGGVDNAGDPASWHVIEFYFNHSTGNVKVWHNKVLIRNDTATNTAARCLPFYLASNWSDAHGPINHAYWDSVEVFSDATTGEPATGNLIDGTAAVEVLVDPCAAVKAENTALKSQVLSLQTEVSTLKDKIAKAKVNNEATITAATKVRSDLL